MKNKNKHNAFLYEKFEENLVKCLLCSHYCEIKENEFGICKTRFNQNGELKALTFGLTDGLAIDPIEKKPFYHFKPGTKVLSFGAPGCNFSCKNCQNSELSQRSKLSKHIFEATENYEPKEIVKAAANHNVDGIAYTYSEPTIFLEYAYETILECRRNPKTKDLFHVFVSNGFFSREAYDFIKDENLFQAINIDLKFIEDIKYRKICGAKLQPVLDSIERIVQNKNKIHLEIINLIIPGQNDELESIYKLSSYLTSLSKDIPLHFSRFFPRYKMNEGIPTPLETLATAKKIAEECGLNYVYIGNTNIPNSENTFCPKCKSLLIERSIYGIYKNLLTKEKKCPNCGSEIELVL